MKTYTSKDEFEGVLIEKHVPTINMPPSSKAGQEFEIEVIVGDKFPHPSLPEHHIEWVRIFAEIDGANFNPAQLAYVEFEPVFSEPRVKIKVKLEKSANIIVQSFCNLHGLWENTSRIRI